MIELIQNMVDEIGEGPRIAEAEISKGGVLHSDARALKTDKSINSFDRAIEKVTNLPSLPDRIENEPLVDYLRRIEESGEFLFHGSPVRTIEELEPRPASDTAGDPWKNDTAVFAVPRAALAIQRAILPIKDRVEGGWNITTGTSPQKHGQPYMEVSPNVGKLIGPGMLYVLPKIGFEEHPSGGQWKSKQTVKPLIKLLVTPEDYTSYEGVLIIQS